VIVDLDPSDALAAASELNRCSASARHRGSNPPAALERVADVLEAAALLERFRLSGSGPVSGVEALIGCPMVCVKTVAMGLGISSRSVRRRIDRGEIAGARRLDPSNTDSPWLIPAAFIAPTMKDAA
jgi:hypothetical protein